MKYGVLQVMSCQNLKLYLSKEFLVGRATKNLKKVRKINVKQLALLAQSVPIKKFQVQAIFFPDTL